MRVCTESVLSASRCRQSAQPLQRGKRGGRGTPEVMEPRMCLLGQETFQIQSPPPPRLFPCHLGFPLFLWIFKRPLVTHIKKGFIYLYRGNNWKPIGCPTFSHSNKPMLTLCDRNKKRKTKVFPSTAAVPSRRILYLHGV